MIIYGTRYFTWGNQPTSEAWCCGNCGTVAPFRRRKGMRWFTLYFIIPVLPLSRVSHLIECPHCRTRYAVDTASGNRQQAPDYDPVGAPQSR
jgi:hypothetical protein